MTNDKILELVLRSIPYFHQLKDFDTTLPKCIQFSWRGSTYRVSESLSVEEVEGNILAGTDSAILMSALLKSVRKIES